MSIINPNNEQLDPTKSFKELKNEVNENNENKLFLNILLQHFQRYICQHYTFFASLNKILNAQKKADHILEMPGLEIF